MRKLKSTNNTERLVINSDKTMSECDGKLYRMYKEHKYLTVTIEPGIDRTALQNALWGAMYRRIASSLGWEFSHARAHCKLYYGVPILRREHPGFSDSFERVFGSLKEEAALRLMSPNKLFISDGFPVTRYFKAKQGIEYTDAIVMGLQEVDFTDLLKERGD